MSEAIIIVGSNRRPAEQATLPRWTSAVGSDGFVTAEILGQSVLQRMVAQLRKAKIDEISLCVDTPVDSECDDRPALTAWDSAPERLRQLSNNGSGAVLIVELNAYFELDFADLLRSHQESGKMVTRVFHEAGPMSLWVVNAAMFPDNRETEMRALLNERADAEYYSSGYINRLETPADLRRLVTDGLGFHCQCRPQGFEVKPGIWMAPGAVIEKAARIVAPAFIGRGVNISDECLITRGSNIESDSEIDYGTTIEASSILSNTYVGIGLDLSHSIAQGSSLLNLQHQVVLHISDPAVMRQNKRLIAGDSRLSLGIGEAVTT